MKHGVLVLAFALSACTVSVPGNQTRLDDLTERIRDLEGYRSQLEPWRVQFVDNVNKSLESHDRDLEEIKAAIGDDEGRSDGG